MKKTRKSAKAAPAEVIARLAERGNDVSPYFTNRGRMMAPVEPALPGGASPEQSLLSELRVNRQSSIVNRQ